jgi:hypothetical protein
VGATRLIEEELFGTAALKRFINSIRLWLKTMSKINQYMKINVSDKLDKSLHGAFSEEDVWVHESSSCAHSYLSVLTC